MILIGDMYAVHSSWQEQDTFKLVPFTQDCPYTEAVYIPKDKVLVVVSKQMYEKMTMVPALDNNGLPMTSGKKDGSYKQQRVKMESFYEYYITDVEQIKEFCKSRAVNPSVTEKYLNEQLTESAN